MRSTLHLGDDVRLKPDPQQEAELRLNVLPLPAAVLASGIELRNHDRKEYPQRMFAQALFAFLAMPGIVAFAVPAIWMWRANRWTVLHPAGLLVLIAGTLALLWCVRDFYVRGKGTLAPWSPPQNLVVVGLYRFSRNPMYVSVVLILLGWASTFSSSGLLIYALAVALAFHLRVVYGEEPWLARTHGEHWQGYVRAVPRWIGFTRSQW